MAEESYKSEMKKGSERRVVKADEVFDSVLLQQSKSTTHEVGRFLISFSRDIAINKAISILNDVGAVIEEVQVLVGEEGYAFPLREDLMIEKKIVDVREAFKASTSARFNEINMILMSSSEVEEKHWLNQSKAALQKGIVKARAEENLLITGVICKADAESLLQFRRNNPGMVRAIEPLGPGIRVMAMPLEYYEGPVK